MIQNLNTGYPPSLFKPKPHVFTSVFHADNSFKIYNQHLRALLNQKFLDTVKIWNFETIAKMDIRLC